MSLTLREALSERRLLLDGAMGTEILRRGLTEADFRGEMFKDHPVALRGNNDVLTLTRPDVITAIHDAYLDAGADIIETCTFNSQRISQAEYLLEAHIDAMNRAGARIARRCADRYTAADPSRPRFVAGSVGPTSRMLSMGAMAFDELVSAYTEQMTPLIEEGVDAILIETIIDPLNAKAALAAAEESMAHAGRKVELMLSLTVNDNGGHLLSGQTIEAFVIAVSHADLLSIGINCSFGADAILPHLRTLRRCCPTAVSVHPNAGLPDEMGQYLDTPEIMAAHIQAYLDEDLADIIGGCCGTTPAHIRALRTLLDNNPASGERRIPTAMPLELSGLEPLRVAEGTFVNVGERCNVAGSRKFLRLISEGAHEEALEIARRQVDDGAMVLDINMDDGMLDTPTEMERFVSLIGQDPAIARVPLMIDSSRFDVIERALKHVQGKAIVNSLSLKEGEEAFLRRAAAVRRLGAAVVVMAFDEDGQATTYQRRVDVCARAYRLLTEKAGFRPADIIFDPNILTVATGMAEHADYAYDFVRATRWIKDNLPGAHVSGGVSNLSFAFRGNNYIREAMHAVFLCRAIEAGMDMAIVNPSSVVTYDSVPADLRRAIEDALFDVRSPRSVEILTEKAAAYSSVKVSESAPPPTADAPVDERLADDLMRGSTATLAQDLNDALAVYPTPLAIIEGPLMQGMKRVGELFGQGRMFLPQVVKTARTMKAAVDILQPHILSSHAADAAAPAKTVLLATVKGDVHDIGKNIVGVILTCNGYTVRDLGVMVPPERIVEEASRGDVGIVCLSGLITPSLDEMACVVRMLERAGLTVPVMVGGATTSELHTAMKIAPEYPSGVVIHMADASQNPLAAAKLLDPATAPTYIAEVKDRQHTLRTEYRRRQSAAAPDAAARALALRYRGDWCCYVPATPPHLGIGEPRLVSVSDLIPLIEWQYFFHAWKVKAGTPEADSLMADAQKLLRQWSEKPDFGVLTLTAFFPARQAPSHDAILISDSEVLPTPRRKFTPEARECPALCDFISPHADHIGIFASAISEPLEAEIALLKSAGADSYEALLAHTLADRLADAAAQHISDRLAGAGWGGIRPAVGYPSLPDQRAIFLLDRLMPLSSIGIRLTENGAMLPASATAGVLIAHPSARYI